MLLFSLRSTAASMTASYLLAIVLKNRMAPSFIFFQEIPGNGVPFSFDSMVWGVLYGVVKQYGFICKDL